MQALLVECQDRAVLAARMAELQSLRCLHLASKTVLRAPGPFVHVMDRLPRTVGDSEAWRQAMLRAQVRFDKYAEAAAPSVLP